MIGDDLDFEDVYYFQKPFEDFMKPGCSDQECIKGLQLITKEDLMYTKEKLPVKTRGKVFVFGDFANESTKNLFRYYGYTTVDQLDEADILCLTGGDDVNPKWYGQKAAGAVGWNDARDVADITAIRASVDKFKVGICRGAQLLNVYPNKGSLWQDVDGHNRPHRIRDQITGMELTVNSIHHQQIRLTDKAELVAACLPEIATVKRADGEKYIVNEGLTGMVNNPTLYDPDVEVAFYPDTRCLLVQNHPEFDIKGPGGIYFNQLLERYYQAA